MFSTDAYILGHWLMDYERKLLFGLITELESKMQKHQSPGVLADLIERLYSYAALHFATEDRLMAETDYSDATSHQAEHELVLMSLRRLEASIQSGALSAPEETLRFMKSWATDHIPNFDRRLAEHLCKGMRQ